MKVDLEQLQDALDYWDGMLSQLLSDPPEDFNIKRYARHYNVVRNSVAYFMAKEIKKRESEKA